MSFRLFVEIRYNYSMISKRQITLLLVLASILLFACALFDNNNEPNASSVSQEDEFALEDAYYATQEAKETEAASVHAPMPNLQIETVPEDADPAFQIFAQYVDVFGLSIYASGEVPAEKVVHAAGVMAQYLDNDEDGEADNLDVVRALQAKHATIFIFPRPDSRDEEDFIDNVEYLLDNDLLALQPLYGEEIVPNGAAMGEFDASLEEIFHLISNTGYATVYPDIFGEEPGSAIADAMDAARGGYFENIPGSYPAGAWFTYDDETCEYNCMISEYHYWAITSLMDGQDYPGRFDEISQEWKLNTPEKLQSGDSAIYALLTDPQYHQPSILPDGNYQPE